MSRMELPIARVRQVIPTQEENREAYTEYLSGNCLETYLITLQKWAGRGLNDPDLVTSRNQLLGHFVSWHKSVHVHLPYEFV
jgi:hypothetical protein